MTHPIIVTGPQRSGTTIAAHIITEQTGGVYVDELEYCLPLPDKAVVQAPFLLHQVLEASYMIPNVRFAFMYRAPGDIVASMERVEWYADWYDDPNFYPTYVKHCYEYIDLLKRTLRKDQWFDVQYESLIHHPLFVRNRAGFTVKQYRPDVPEGPATWRNNEYLGLTPG